MYFRSLFYKQFCMRKIFALFFLSLFFIDSLVAQVGGEGVYSFLNLTITPRSAALGSKVVALDEPDPGVVFTNPAHLNFQHNNQLALSYISYFADIKYGFVSYSRHYEKIGTFGIGLQHVGYGDFIEADASGTITGSFTGYDMALNLIYSRTFDSLITVGINIKPIYSHLEQYRSYGICADIGVAYTNREHLFTAGIVARNIGTMLKPYTPDTWERLPFELVAGVSQKLKHAPFRFVATFQQLQTTSLYYQRQKQTISFFDEEEQESKSFFDKFGNEFVSHLIFGVEFVPVQNFYVRAGYNFQRRNELKIEDITSSAGFSWGLGVKINKFHVNYSRATYHLVGASNHFSISTDLDDFFVKKNL
jgi:opacity protein-like surface antigen